MTREKRKQKRKPDEEDVQIIYADVMRFAKMSSEDRKTHFENHPEDRLHTINLPEPEGGFMNISHAASDRFWNLTHRLLKSNKLVRGDFDESMLNQAVREAFARYFLIDEKPIEQRSVDRMLNQAEQTARENHAAVTHYLPCVVVTKREPKEFRLGVVRFIRADKFFEDYGAQINRDLDSQSRENDREELAGPLMPEEERSQIAQMALAWIHEYYKQYDWIAEVAVPPADPKVSRRRAEFVVQASIDLLKTFFNLHWAKRLRLGHDRASPDKTADLIRTAEERFEWRIARSGIAGALVEDGWFEQIRQQYGRYLNAAGQAIETYLSPHQPTELCERWLDALNWYGQAVSEPLPSAQIVKYTAALERLTITKEAPGVTDSVTRRTAILVAADWQESFEAVRKDARDVYEWRSNLMHGSSSPSSKDESIEKEMRAVRYRADDLTRRALFNAIAVYANLLANGKAKSKDLEEWFQKREVD